MLSQSSVAETNESIPDIVLNDNVQQTNLDYHKNENMLCNTDVKVLYS